MTAFIIAHQTALGFFQNKTDGCLNNTSNMLELVHVKVLQKPFYLIPHLHSEASQSTSNLAVTLNDSELLHPSKNFLGTATCSFHVEISRQPLMKSVSPKCN